MTELIATAYATPALNAPVRVLRVHDDDDYAVVQTLPGGVGFWSVVGYQFTIRLGKLRDIREQAPAAPKPVTKVQAEPVVDAAPDVDPDVSPELAALKAELAALGGRIVANFDRPTGGRGKRGLQRTDAAIRRGAQMVAEYRRLESKIATLEGKWQP